MLIDDSEWIKAERSHEREMADMMNRNNRDRRQQITERVQAVSWAVGITLVVAILVAGIYYWQHDAGQRGKQAELACITAGGTWTTIGGGQSKTCVYFNEDGESP